MRESAVLKFCSGIEGINYGMGGRGEFIGCMCGILCSQIKMKLFVREV